MNTISAVVIDDEINISKLLVHFLKKYCPLVNVVGAANTRGDGINMVNALKPKVLFLDIELDIGTGFGLLDEVEHEEMAVIFVTGFDDYAVKAFKYNAADYILKPIQIDELVLSVNKIYQKIEKEQFIQKKQLDMLSNTYTDTKAEINFIAVPSQSTIDFIKLENILYLQSDGRYTIFNLVDGKTLLSVKNLGEYENLLNPNSFFRIHNSYIINLRHSINIDRAGGNYLQMAGGKHLPIARRRLVKLERFLNLK